MLHPPVQLAIIVDGKFSVNAPYKSTDRLTKTGKQWGGEIVAISGSFYFPHQRNDGTPLFMVYPAWEVYHFHAVNNKALSVLRSSIRLKAPLTNKRL